MELENHVDRPHPAVTAARSLEGLIVEVGRDLASAFNGVLNAIPGGPHRPQLLARTLGVNTVVTSRILKAARQRDPMAVAHMIPGPEPLRRLLRSAERKNVDAALIREARAAVDRFEQLIAEEAGDRSSLDAIISGWLPDARQKVELLAKQAVFRGVSQLLGATCDAQHFTTVLYPSREQAGRADQLWMLATRGLRRVRPGLVFNYDTVHAPGRKLTVTGQPIEGLQGLMLEPFCSKPLPQLEVTPFLDRAQYTLLGHNVGVRSAVDLVHATLLPGKKELFGPAGATATRKTMMAAGIATPSKSVIFDTLLHEDVYPGQQPGLYVYRSVPGAVIDPNDPSRDVDRFDVIESILPLGQGIAKFRAADSPAYLDMLNYVCAQRRWDGQTLRGYRCRIEFPIYSSEVVMTFDLPPGAERG